MPNIASSILPPNQSAETTSYVHIDLFSLKPKFQGINTEIFVLQAEEDGKHVVHFDITMAIERSNGTYHQYHRYFSVENNNGTCGKILGVVTVAVYDYSKGDNPQYYDYGSLEESLGSEDNLLYNAVTHFVSTEIIGCTIGNFLTNTPPTH